MPDTDPRPPRWDPDERGIGVADARQHGPLLDALRDVAGRDGWVAEEPEAHLLPHLLAEQDHAGWRIASGATRPDGTLEVALAWGGAHDAAWGTRRIGIFALIASIAESTTVVHERRDGDGTAFDVVTGLLPDDTVFATHGHTLRLRVPGANDAGDTGTATGAGD